MFKKIFLVQSICLVSLGSAYAQQWFTPSPLSSDSLVFGNLDWGDYDQDGDQDLLAMGAIVSGGQKTVLYENQNGVFTEVNTPFANAQNGTCKFYDFDNDNDLDVIVSGLDGLAGGAVTRTYENVNGIFQQVDLGIDDAYFSSIVTFDHDHDGDEDLLLTGWVDGAFPGSVQFYENQIDTFILDTSIVFPNVTFGSVDATDLDHDGNVDLVISGTNPSSPQYVEIFEYDPNTSTFVSQVYTLEGISNSWVKFFDYNDDGYDDLLLYGVDGSYNNRLMLYENDGTTLTFRQSMDSLSSTTSKNPVITGDIDNDGDNDILVGGSNDDYDYLMLAYINEADSFVFAPQVGLPQWGSNTSLAFHDVDNDLDLDFAFAGRDNGTIEEVAVHLFTNDSAATNTIPQAPSYTSDQVMNNVATLSWNRGSDNETRIMGLTYNLGLYHTTGSEWILAPKTLPSGQRMVTKRGNLLQDTVTMFTDLEPGVYHWQVQSIDNAFVPSSLTSDSFIISDLSAFNLTSPAHQSTLSIYPINEDEEFAWESCDNATSYKFSMLNSSGTQVIFDRVSNQSGSDTVFTIAHKDLYELAFDEGQTVGSTETYSWYVMAYGQYDSLLSVDTLELSIELLQYPLEFDLVELVDKDTVTVDVQGSNSYEFKWTTAEGVDDEYEIQLTTETDTQFGSPVWDDDTSDTTIVVGEDDLADDLTQAGHSIGTTKAYLWRVIAEGEFANTVSNQTHKLYIKVIDSSVGIEEQVKEAVRYTPMPFTNSFQLENANSKEIRNLTVHNLLGEVVIQVTVVSSNGRVSITTKDWPSGIYVLSFVYHGKSISQQIIKD